MGMMDSMMKGMIKAMPVEEREELMLKLMPDMMKQVEMVPMMKNMKKELTGRISLLSIIEFVQTLAKDEALKGRLKETLGDFKKMMPAMMEMMHPMMMPMMSSFMPKMMSFMPTMMPNMKEMMPQMMEETMIPMIKEKPEMKAHMLGMMQTMFPHCAANMFPLIEKDDRVEFVQRLYGIMAKSASIEMDVEEKDIFQKQSTGAVKDALLTNA